MKPTGYDNLIAAINLGIDCLYNELINIRKEFERHNNLLDKIITYHSSTPEERIRTSYKKYRSEIDKKQKENRMDLQTLLSNLNDKLENTYGSSGNQFIQDQAALVSKFTSQLTSNQITQEQYQGLIEDIQRLTKLEELQQEVEKKAIYQGFENMIQDLIIDGISEVFKSKNS